jgi:hypothetical protein
MSVAESVCARARRALALACLGISVLLSSAASAQVLIDETFDSSPCPGEWVCRGSAAWVPPLPASSRCDALGADPNDPFGDGVNDCTLYPDEGYVVLAPGLVPPGYQSGAIFDSQRRRYDDFKITAVIELRDGTRPDPADGMCIVIAGTENPPEAGVWGGGMGATGLGSVPTLIVEFDTWGLNAGDSNDWNHAQVAWSPTGFPAVESIAIGPAEGVKASIPQATWPLNNREAPPASPNRFTAEIHVQDGTVSLFLTNDDASTPLSRTLFATYEIPGFTPFDGYLGVTAATGGAAQNHILHSIRLEELHEFLRGDVNNDGWVSMGDALYILDHTYLGGPGYTCREAADTSGDDEVNITDAVVILNFLFLGGPSPGSYPACEIAASANCVYPVSPCGAFEPRNPEPTIRLEFGVDRLVEEGAAGDGVEGVVQLRNTEPGDLPVRGWSLSIRVGPQPDCRILDPTIAGTLAEDAQFHVTRTAEGPEGRGIVSSIVIATTTFTTLPGNEIPHDLLRFTLHGAFVPGECSPCLLEFHDGLVADLDPQVMDVGRPVRNLVNSLRRDFQPFSRPAEVRFCSSVAPLVPGGAPAVLGLPVASPTRLFKLQPRPAVGSVITIDLEGADPADATALYARWGGAPSPVEFDHAADERGRASQRLVIPFARDEPCYVLVQGNVVAGESVDGTLTAAEAVIALERASADCGAEGCDGMIHIAVQGAGFDSTTSFLLERPPGLNLPALESTIVTAERAELAFDLSVTSPGMYDLVARKGTGPTVATARLAGAVRVERRRIGPRLEVSLEGPTYYREYQLRSMILRYANTGDEEMPAPLFEIRAFSTRPGTSPVRLGVAKEEGLRPWEFPDFFEAGAGAPEVVEGPLQVLGIHAPGIPGRLPAGASGEIPILFRHPDPFTNPPLPGERLEFFLEVLDPGATGRLEWSRLATPQGMASGEWTTLRAELAARYAGYLEALSAAASRLARRGERPWGVKDLFRFAALSATGRKTAVILGTARRPTLEPLASGLVGAIQGEDVVACSLTDSEGAFALGPLANGTYRLAIEGHTLAITNVTISGNEDEFPVILQAFSEDGSSLACPSTGDPDAALFPDAPGLPDGLLEPVAEMVLKPAVSEDPNSKEGSDEPVMPGYRAHYTIHFENCSKVVDPECSEVEGAARKVVLIDELSPLLDPGTVKFLELQMGEVEQLSPPAEGGTDLASGYSWSTNSGRYDLKATLPVSLDYPPDLAPVFILADYEVSVVTTLEKLMDVTYDLCGPEIPRMDPALMNPEDCAFQADLAVVSGKLKATPPVAHIIWVISGNDPVTNDNPRGYPSLELVGLVPPNDTPPKGQGLVAYDVQVRESAMDEEEIENNARIIFDTNPADPAEPAVRRVGVPFRRGDVDFNLQVDLTDPINILNCLFVGHECTTCLDAADANDDGDVNVSDPIAILNFLFVGTDPPRPPGPFECGFDTTHDIEGQSGPVRNLGCDFDRRRCTEAELDILARGGEP